MTRTVTEERQHGTADERQSVRVTRPTDPRHAGQVEALLAAFAAVMGSRYGARVDRAYLRRLMDGEGIGFVLARGEQAVGFVAGYATTAGEPQVTLWIEGVYVRPGEGRAAWWLWRLLRRAARARGISRIGGQSPRPAMMRLARRMGFSPTAVCYARSV